VKIVFFIDHLRADGTQLVLRQLVKGFTERGHVLAVVCLNRSFDSGLVQELRALAVEVRFLGKFALASGCGLAVTRRWLKREQFDIAVTLLFHSDVVGRLLAHTSGIPRIVSSLRARNTHYAAWQRALVRRTMPLAETIIVNSVGIRDFAIAEEGARAERIVVIPNGVCVEDYAHPIERAALRAELGQPQHRRLIGSVGRLTHQKGLDLLIAALARIAAQDVDLLLVGVGEEQQRLQAQAAALGLADRVHLVGYRRDVPRLLGALDLYVHPARFEGMPNALLEAMAAGCPIVATAVDGNRELIEDGVHGWLVPPEDVEALSRAIDAALAAPTLAAQYGAAAQHRAEHVFSVEAMVDAWEAILAQRHSSPKTYA
jgi:glycosyltransferase involved in cell wall biosynthesis